MRNDRSRHAMTCYRVSGFVFASAISFPELTPTRPDRIEARFAVTRARLAAARPSWYHRWGLPGGVDWLRLARADSGYLLRFPRLTDFLVSADGQRVCCRPRAGVPIATIRHLFLNQVLPLVMSQRGRIVVHASAVVTPAGAVAFLGESRRGKSTLAASFWAAGYPLVTDDCLRLDTRRGVPMTVPGYPGLRLWPDAVRRLAIGGNASGPVADYTDKVRVGFGPGGPGIARRRVRLARVYVLAAATRQTGREALRIEPLTGRETLVAMIAHLYRLDIGRRDALRQDFDRLARLARRVSARRLYVPHSFPRLTEVREAILSDLGL